MTQKRERFVGSSFLEGREERIQNTGGWVCIWWEPGTAARWEGARWKEAQVPTGSRQGRPGRAVSNEAAPQGPPLCQMPVWSLYGVGCSHILWFQARSFTEEKTRSDSCRWGFYCPHSLVVPGQDLVCISHALSHRGLWCERILAIQRWRKNGKKACMFHSDPLILQSRKPEEWAQTNQLGLKKDGYEFLYLSLKKFRTCLKLEETWQLVLYT